MSDTNAPSAAGKVVAVIFGGHIGIPMSLTMLGLVA